MFTFLGSTISSGRPPLFPSSGSAALDSMISEALALPLIRKSAVFVDPLAPPDGKPAASLKLITVRGSLGAHENPCARASPPKARKTPTISSTPFAPTAVPPSNTADERAAPPSSASGEKVTAVLAMAIMDSPNVALGSCQRWWPHPDLSDIRHS